jgi:hypothetical protein
MVDDAIRDALPGLWAGKLRAFGGFRSRLALAVALAILPELWTPAIRELAQLRNDFAHGKIEHLNRMRVRRLARPVEPMIENFDEVLASWENVTPTMVLRDVIYIIHWGVRAMIEQDRDRRYEAGVAAIVAGAMPKRIMAKWKAEGSPGA